MKHFLELAYHQTGRDERSHVRHSHDDCLELIQVWTDRGCLLMKDKLYQMTPGALFLINGLDMHSTNPEDAEAYTRSKIVVSAQFINALAELTGISELIGRLFYQNGGSQAALEWEQVMWIDGLFRKAVAARGTQREDAVASICLMELLTFLDDCEGVSAAPAASKLFNVMEYIGRNYNQPLSIDRICESVHVSKYYICHLFKSLTDMTIMQYITQLRLAAAKKDLLYTDKSISEIAMAAGFSSLSLFNKNFRRFESCTPREYRTRRRTEVG